MDVAITAHEAAQQRQKLQRRSLRFLLAPATTWLLVFFMTPLLIMLVISFLKRGTYGGIVPEFNLANYAQLLNQDYFIIFQRTMVLAVATTVLCLVIAYPMAYWIARQPPRLRTLLVMLVIIPFWTNFLVRTYAWMILLRNEGVINTLLMGLGIINEPLTLLFTEFAVIVGLVYGELPFMVLPLYANLEKFDYSLMEAAHDAGANNFWAFVRVMLPLTLPGIVAGCILVFIPSIGAFVTPDILGGSKSIMIGNLIDRQFKAARDWPFASTISITLMVMVSLAVALYFRVVGESDRTSL
jgi:spermidine/putrescine transport system permease protein